MATETKTEGGRLRTWLNAGETRRNIVAFKFTDAEEQRLEELRKSLRMKSRADVVRLAIMLLELAVEGQEIEAHSPDDLIAYIESLV